MHVLHRAHAAALSILPAGPQQVLTSIPYLYVTLNMHVLQDFVEGVQTELQKFDMDTQALSTGVKERVHKLLNSSSEVCINLQNKDGSPTHACQRTPNYSCALQMFQLAPCLAAEDSRQGAAHAR